jgi:hypothetical protein
MIDQHARRARRVRLSAADEAMVRRGAIMLEDALQTASLPGADSARLLIVRSFSVGKIQSNQAPSSLALAIEDRFRHLDATAIHAEDPAAGSHAAVYFTDPVEPYVRLAVRLAAGAKTDEWFWPLAVPCWRQASPRDEALRSLLYEVIRTSAGVMAGVAMIRQLHESRVADSLLSALRWEDGPRLLRAYGWSKPELPAALIEAPAADPVEEAMLEEWSSSVRSIGRWGADDARSIWLATIILVAENPARLMSRRLASRATRLVKLAESRFKRISSTEQKEAPARSAANAVAQAMRHAGEAQGEREASVPEASVPEAGAREDELRLPREAFSESGDLVIEETAPAVEESAEPVESPPVESLPVESSTSAREDAAPQPEPVSLPWTDGPRPTDYAGLFFLLQVMSRLDIAGALEADPDLIEMNLPHRLLRYVGERIGVPADDPVMMAFAQGRGKSGEADKEDGEDVKIKGDVSMILRAWLTKARRWLRRYARMGVVELVQRRGRIAATRTHIDIIFYLDQTDIRIRRAGLDVDPGWVPWFGRVIQFHYLSGRERDGD